MDKLFKLNASHVYILTNELNRVKIGITKDIEQRKKTISLASGSLIKEQYKTELINNAKEIEKTLHSHFNKYRYIGEWFNITPLEAKKELIKLNKEYKQDNNIKIIYSNKPKIYIANKLGISKQHLNNINKRIGLKTNETKDKPLKETKPITITTDYKRVKPNEYYNKKENHTLIKKWINGQMIDTIIQH
jgi:hypothetical protein